MTAARVVHHARVLAAAPWLGAAMCLAGAYVACGEVGRWVAGEGPR